MEILKITQELENMFSSYDLCRPQANQIKLLREKLQKREITIAVIGQFKRGKTTLVNNVLEKNLLPVGIVPITAAVTRISYGKEKAQVIFENGLKEDVQISELSQYISEQENHDNRLGVSEVRILTEAEFLKEGLVLVDTPGVGSVHEKNSQKAYEFVKESDAVIFMLSVDSPINQIETEFLENVKHYAGKFYFSVNKIDVIDEDELKEYLAYCRGLISGLMQRADVKLFAVSAKKGRGVQELKSAIASDLSETAGEIMEQSVRLKLLEILKSTKLQISSYRNVLNMAPNVFNSRFKEMHEIISKLRDENNMQTGMKDIPVTKLNEEKSYLIVKIKELFGIEYYYDIEKIEATDTITSEEYIKRAEALYTELETTLNTRFMYKDENAYTVARRIEDLNMLMRKMEQYQDLLQAKA